MIEQYIENKSGWLPDLETIRRDGVPERHERGVNPRISKI